MMRGTPETSRLRCVSQRCFRWSLVRLDGGTKRQNQPRANHLLWRGCHNKSHQVNVPFTQQQVKRTTIILPCDKDGFIFWKMYCEHFTWQCKCNNVNPSKILIRKIVKVKSVIKSHFISTFRCFYFEITVAAACVELRVPASPGGASLELATARRSALKLPAECCKLQNLCASTHLYPRR